MTTGSCCTVHPIAAERLGPVLRSTATTISPANYGRRTPTRSTPQADLLVVGHISTGDPSTPSAEAMAVRDGRIVGIGSRSDVDGLTGPATTIVAPDGVVIPGLVEPHMHIWASLLNLDWLDLSHEACPTFDDVVSALRSAVGGAAPGEPLMAKQFDPSLYPGEPVLTRDLLDRISPDRSVVVVNASLHYMYANSTALAAAGVTDTTPDPPGGTFGRVDGRLNGVIGEVPAMMALMAAVPMPTADQITDGVRRILDAAARRGVTSLREAATGTLGGVGELALLHQINGSRRLPVRVSTAQFSIMGDRTPSEVAAAWRDADVTPFSGDDMVRADAWKVVTDGSNQGRSGYFLQPYLGEESGGKANWTPEGLRDVLEVGLCDGWQVMVHTNGDAAVEFALCAMEDLLPHHPAGDLRHRFEHVSFSTDDQLTRMAAAGISPSFLMNHVYFWGAAFRDTILGPDRAQRLDRVASAYAAGMRPSLHSDYTVTEIHPLLSARTAVQRRLQADGTVLNPAECVSPDQALAAITTHAAWQIHADDRGSLGVGQRADFAVVSDDPWSSDPDGWPEITVSETYLDGTPAYQG